MSKLIRVTISMTSNDGRSVIDINRIEVGPVPDQDVTTLVGMFGADVIARAQHRLEVRSIALNPAEPLKSPTPDVSDYDALLARLLELAPTLDWTVDELVLDGDLTAPIGKQFLIVAQSINDSRIILDFAGLRWRVFPELPDGSIPAPAQIYDIARNSVARAALARVDTEVIP